MEEVQKFEDKIELLSLNLFDTNQEEIEIVEVFQKYFNTALGWHYYLDLAWIVREIKKYQEGPSYSMPGLEVAFCNSYL
ncbi:MAG: hypothetical protein IH613_16015 [Desulfuromonadales bacterium]|nr:hypothetical protein [Desulfuromonadales bacterium]